MVTLYDAARLYNHANPGFGAGGAVPDAPAQDAQIAKALHYAKTAQLPESFQWGGGYLHLVLAQLARPTVCPAAARLMEQELLHNPAAAELVKALEFGLAVLAERSPETWQHLLHHTALTMMAFEPLHGSVAEHKTHALQALVGALGHDMGKLAIDPALLHKHTRLEPRRFDDALAHFEQQVPDYPQKAHDIAFLKQAQAGLIVFCGKTLDAHPPATHETIPLGDLKSSETHSTTDAQRSLHTRILARIDAKARQHIAGAGQGEWLKPAEIVQLASSERGTLTATQKAIVNSHDPMSARFFAQIALPDRLKPLPEIVNMDAFRGKQVPASADSRELADIIHTTDVFEALTANRSYRRAYDVDGALQVMDAMATRGEVPQKAYDTLKNKGIFSRYGKAYGLALGEAPTQTNWADRVSSPASRQQQSSAPAL